MVMRRLTAATIVKPMAELYTSTVLREDGTEEIVGYAYGEEWVAQALLIDDIKFKTPEEAKEW